MKGVCLVGLVWNDTVVTIVTRNLRGEYVSGDIATPMDMT